MMHPVRRKKLINLLILMMVLGVVVALMMYALRQNISLFYTPTDMALGKIPPSAHVRLGGCVVNGSIIRGDDLNIRFKLTDFNQGVEVSYRGILPDLFREGQGLVVEGRALDHARFEADRVLAKHDENYMPPEAKAALALGAKIQQKAHE